VETRSFLFRKLLSKLSCQNIHNMFYDFIFNVLFLFFHFMLHVVLVCNYLYCTGRLLHLVYCLLCQHLLIVAYIFLYIQSHFFNTFFSYIHLTNYNQPVIHFLHLLLQKCWLFAQRFVINT